MISGFAQAIPARTTQDVGYGKSPTAVRFIHVAATNEG